MTWVIIGFKNTVCNKNKKMYEKKFDYIIKDYVSFTIFLHTRTATVEGT